jgi:preprotein translocase subunit SecA
VREARQSRETLSPKPSAWRLLVWGRQEAQRFFVLTQTDNLWKEHLQAIKFLQQAVGLRGYAQRDPLVEYKLEGWVACAPLLSAPLAPP